jgi:uncharacterized protein YjeT (DUF2065 family)
MMMQTFLMAVGLVFILEGLMPFLGPRFYRRMMQQMLLQSDTTLRVFGLTSMLSGLGLLYFVH